MFSFAILCNIIFISSESKTIFQGSSDFLRHLPTNGSIRLEKHSQASEPTKAAAAAAAVAAAIAAAWTGYLPAISHIKKRLRDPTH